MNLHAAFLVLSLVAEGIGVAQDVAELARKAKEGEPVTDEEIQAARETGNRSVERWDAAADNDKES